MKRMLLCLSLMSAALPVQAKTVIQEIKTASGYTVWLSEDHTLPLVTYTFSFERSGAAYDPAGKEGAASYLTQMLDEGAGQLNSLAFHQALENKAIRYSASAGEDTINVSVQSLSEHRKEALRLMLLTLTQPTLEKEAMERIRASIVADLSQLQEEPNYKASLAWKGLVYGGHPYSHPRRGTLASVAAITDGDLRSFAASHFFNGQQPVIAVAGDITPEEIRHWELPALGTKPTPPAVAEIAHPEGKDIKQVAHDVPQTVVLLSLPGLKRSDPQFYALQVLNHVLGGDSITSRLGTQVRNNRGLAYYIGSTIEVEDGMAYLAINFSTRADAAAEALGVVKDELKFMVEHGATQQELTDAKNYLTGSFALEHDTQAEWAGFLIGIQHFNLGKDYPNKRNELIEKVTLDDVNALAKQLLSHTPVVVMVGKQAGESAPVPQER